MKSLTKWASLPVSSQAHEAFTASLNLIAIDLASVEQKINEQAICFDAGVNEYVAYACGGSGKRLRPVLALLSAGATGEKISQDHQSLAVILELIHIATLVHDDIMDGAELRRGQPTLHAKWGNSISVLIGDLLFSHALKMAASFSKADVCRRISDAVIEVCSGEILQTQRRFDLGLKIDDYYRMVQMKTGALFASACELSALLNDADQSTVEVFKNYGNSIGTAYQILDDCVDLVGSQEKIGKTLGTDLNGGKFTLPILMLLQSASEKERELLHQFLLSNQRCDMEKLISMTLEKETLAASVKAATELINEAEEKLKSTTSNRYVEGLCGIGVYLKGVLETLI